MISKIQDKDSRVVSSVIVGIVGALVVIKRKTSDHSAEVVGNKKAHFVGSRLF